MNEGFTIQTTSSFEMDEDGIFFFNKCQEIATKFCNITGSGLSILFSIGPECEFRWRGKTVSKLALNGLLPHHKRQKDSVFCQRRVYAGLLHMGSVEWCDVLQKVMQDGFVEILKEEIIERVERYQRMHGSGSMKKWLSEIIA